MDLDIMRYDYSNSEDKKQKFNEIIEALKSQGELIVRPMILWNKVLILAKDVAARDINLVNMYKRLKEVENHFNKLKVGK